MIEREAVIVGAGPAGMAAAIALCEAGMEPTVIDENPRVGGQIYRRPPAPQRRGEPDAADAPSQRGIELHRRFNGHRDRIELLAETPVWGLFPPGIVATGGDGGSRLISARQCLLATGAGEYVPPFPGWTLPGVMTPGGAQSMVKSMSVLPGRRAVVAGSGPFLLVVAAQLHDAGVEVAAVVEAARRRDLLRHGAGLLASMPMLREGRRCMRRLRRAGIPLLWGHVVVEAAGAPELSRVVIAPCDAQARPDRRRARSLEADTLCIGYGFVPRTELAQMAGCRMSYAEALGGWIPEVDEHLATSVPGIRVAGDGGGVAGALVAQLEGMLAGLAMARRAGRLDEGAWSARRRPVARQLAALRRFRSALDSIYRVRPGLVDLPGKDTLVCRCEELTRGEVEAGIANGGTDVRTLKVITRLGMGPCQGRMCWPAAARLIASRTGRSMSRVGPASVRPPIHGLCLGDLCPGPAEGDGEPAAVGAARQKGPT